MSYVLSLIVAATLLGATQASSEEVANYKQVFNSSQDNIGNNSSQVNIENSFETDGYISFENNLQEPLLFEELADLDVCEEDIKDDFIGTPYHNIETVTTKQEPIDFDDLF